MRVKKQALTANTLHVRRGGLILNDGSYSGAKGDAHSITIDERISIQGTLPPSACT